MKSIKFLGAILCICLAFCLFAPLINSPFMAYADSSSVVYDEKFFTDANTYNATLTETSVRGGNDKYNSVSYDLSNKRSDVVVSTGAPQVTFITHGLNSSASNWSNEYSKTGSSDFVYTDDSIIELLRQKADCNIYLFKFTALNTCDLYKLNAKNYSISSSTSKVDKITDNTKHSIVIFETAQSDQSNDYIYTQFNIMASKVILDLQALDANHALPRVNLIGHSRGGLTNLQYALDHPALVDSIFSLGTPYLGSTSASIDNYLLDGIATGNSFGEDDITDPGIYLDYLRRWNENYDSLYSNIKVHAMGGYQSIDMLVYQLIYQISKDYLTNDLINFSSKTLLKGLNVYLSFKLGKLDSVISNVLKQEVISGILNIVYKNIPDLQKDTTVVNGITALLNLLFDELQYNPSAFSYDLLNDVLVDLPSQLGMDYQSDDEYKGFIHYAKRFGIYGNYDLDKISMDAPSVTHNLEARDTQMLAYIVKNINMSAVRNNSPYLVVDCSSIENPNSVSIIGYIGNNVSGTLTIPSQIYVADGSNEPKTIVEIGNGAFANNMNGETSITSVVIPSTVKTIEEGAFYNNEFLTNISFASGNSNLVSIGERAFCNLPNLTSFIIPNSVNFIGDGAFSDCNNLNITVASNNQNYCAIDNILYDKNKTKLISACNVPTEVVIPNSVVQISPYAFENNEKIRFVHFNNNVSIGIDSFNNCEFLTAIYFYSTDLPNLGSGSFANNDFTVYVPMVSQAAYENAFASYTDKIDSILVHIDFESDGSTLYARDVYYGSLLSDLPTPEKTGYDLLGWNNSNSFDGEEYENGDLWLSKTDCTLYAEWSPKQYYIDFEGFASDGLTNKTVTYDSPIGSLPSVVRNGYTFLGWKTQDGQYYNANTIWTETNNIVLTSDWDANTYSITYDGNGGTENVSTQQVVYGSTVNELSTAERVGYEFIGWNTEANGAGQTYSAPFISTIDSNITLYAQWDTIDYQITYDLHDGVLTQANPSIYTILSNDIVLNNPTKTGYSFAGWYEGNNIVTAILTGSYGNRHLIARWTANQYTVTLDANGGSLDGINTFVVTYESAFAITAIPHKDGYTFDGWYDSENVKYATDSGESVICWDKAYNATLYAHWSIKSYEIQINNNGAITWLGSNGLSDDQCSIEYGTVLSSINLIAAYKQSSQGYKEGKIFDHFEYEGSNVSWTSVPDLGVDGSVITITPIWVLEEHTIYFNTLYSATFEPIVADYDTNIVFPSINRNGYVFEGWYTSATGGTKVAWVKMPDLTLNSQNNGSVTLFAHYNSIPYTVTYNLDGGMNASDNPTSYNIDSDITLHNPTKTGYNFAGWYLDVDKTIQVTTLGNTTGNKTLYAKWTPITYVVKYNANGGEGNTEEITHTYDVAKNLMANSFSKTGYHFIGWATSATGNVVYSNSQSVINLRNLDNDEIILYAKWDRNIYYINYNPNGGTGSMVSSVHTYDVYKNLTPNAFTRSGFVFSGWSTAPNSSVNYTNSQSVINLTSIQNGEVTLYAIWDQIYTVRFYNADGTYYHSVSGVSGTAVYLPTMTKGGYTGTWNYWGWMTGNSSVSNFGLYYYIGSFDISLTVVWKEKMLTECYNNGVYEIWTLGQFNGLRTIGTAGKIFAIMADINLGASESNSWVPISGFDGTLRGNYHTISNMIINTSANSGWFGLFESNAGRIENLTVTGYIIVNNVDGGHILAGMFAGVNWSSGVIYNCTSNLYAESNNYYANTELVNGVVMHWNYEILCYRDFSEIGGFVGQNQGTISYCTNNSDMCGGGDVAGIAGTNHGGIISYCTNNRSIDYWRHYSNRCVAGITGYFNGGSINYCTNNGEIACVNLSFSNDTSVFPQMAQIIGRKVAGSNTGNICNGIVDQGELKSFDYGFLWSQTHNQAMYVSNGEIGQNG